MQAMRCYRSRFIATVALAVVACLRIPASTPFLSPRASRPSITPVRPICGEYVLRIGERPVSRVLVCLNAIGLEEDPWAVLGVARGSSTAEIKKAYRKKALKEHPDVNKSPDAKESWQKLSTAYDILSDPEKLRKWEASRQGNQRGAQSNPPPRTETRGSSGSSRQDTKSRSTYDGADAGYKATGSAFRTAAAAASAAANIAGKAAGAVAPGVVDVGKKAVGVAGTAAAVAGLAGKSVMDGISPSAARIAKMQLKDLLSFLGQDSNAGSQRAPSSAASSRAPGTKRDVQVAQEEADRLQTSIDAFMNEQQSWELKAKTFEASGDKYRELDALKRALEARDKRKAATSKLLDCYEAIDALRQR